MFILVQLGINNSGNVKMTTAGMVIMVNGDHRQSKQFSMDMEKQDWTLGLLVYRLIYASCFITYLMKLEVAKCFFNQM